jgi:hypothetical protein
MGKHGISIPSLMNDILSGHFSTLELRCRDQPLEPYFAKKGMILCRQCLHSGLYCLDQVFVPRATFSEDNGSSLLQFMGFEADFETPVERIPYPFIFDVFRIKSEMVSGFDGIERKVCRKVFKQTL